jgi:hypothetical protein
MARSIYEGCGDIDDKHVLDNLGEGLGNLCSHLDKILFKGGWWEDRRKGQGESKIFNECRLRVYLCVRRVIIFCKKTPRVEL